MAERVGRGPAYSFWVRVKAEQASRGWTDSELYRRSGVSRNTIKDLGVRTRVEAETINALAEVLDIPLAEAHQLAGLVPADEQSPAAGGPVSVREAVKADPIYTDQQRRTMLELLDIFEQANKGDGERGRRAG